jgi:hypothetical protein
MATLGKSQTGGAAPGGRTVDTGSDTTCVERTNDLVQPRAVLAGGVGQLGQSATENDARKRIGWNPCQARFDSPFKTYCVFQDE